MKTFTQTMITNLTLYAEDEDIYDDSLGTPVVFSELSADDKHLVVEEIQEKINDLKDEVGVDVHTPKRDKYMKLRGDIFRYALSTGLMDISINGSNVIFTTIYPENMDIKDNLIDGLFSEICDGHFNCCCDDTVDLSIGTVRLIFNTENSNRENDSDDENSNSKNDNDDD